MSTYTLKLPKNIQLILLRKASKLWYHKKGNKAFSMEKKESVARLYVYTQIGHECFVHGLEATQSLKYHYIWLICPLIW